MTIGRWLGRAMRPLVRRVRWDDRGASAIEWAIIAAVGVVLISAVGAVLFTVVNDKGDQITQCANQPVGTQC